LAKQLPGDRVSAQVDVQLIDRLRASMGALLAEGDRLASTFYALLFERYPFVRPLFPQDMTEQRLKLARTLAWVVTHLDRPDQLLPAVRELGRRHVKYGALPEHYPLVRDTLVEAMTRVAGTDWDAALAEDWRQSIDLLGRHMLGLYPPAAARP
jgi:nitric oxide dioxygenase